MRSFTFLISLFIVSSVFASEPTVKITSFVYNGQDKRAAELCGIVFDQTTTPTFVQVVVDQTTNRPANYNTLVGPDGKFCIAVVTFRGTAIAKILQ